MYIEHRRVSLYIPIILKCWSKSFSCCSHVLYQCIVSRNKSEHCHQLVLTEIGSVDEAWLVKRRNNHCIGYWMNCSLVYTWALQCSCSILIWCNDNWKVYQIANLFHWIKSITKGTGKPSHVGYAFTNTVDLVNYLLQDHSVAREKAAGFHTTPCTGRWVSLII